MIKDKEIPTGGVIVEIDANYLVRSSAFRLYKEMILSWGIEGASVMSEKFLLRVLVSSSQMRLLKNVFDKNDMVIIVFYFNELVTIFLGKLGKEFLGASI